MTELERALMPFTLRVRRLRAVTWGAWGLMTGAAAALLIRLSSYLWPFPTALYWCAAVCAATPALFALVARLAPANPLRVARKIDARGLQARAQTALMLRECDTPMAQMQREDALETMRGADPKRLLPARAPKLALFAAAGCAALFGLSFAIANPHTEALQARAEYRAAMTQEADKVDEGAAALDADDPQAQELRRLLGDLSRELREAGEAKDALSAVNRAETGIEKLQAATAAEAQKALEKAGLSELARAAMADEQAAEELLRQMQAAGDASLLRQAANASASATAQKALGNAAKALQSGNAAAALQSLQAALSGQTSATAQAMALSGMARASALQAASGATASFAGAGLTGAASVGGTGAQGASASAGTGGGSGAGLGTSNKDAGYGGAQQPGAAAGTSDPQKKVAEYEPVYDPTRLNAGGTQTNEKGAMGEGDVFEAEAGTGLGDASGSVPYNVALQQYREEAVAAERTAQLPPYARDWVEEYFRLLAE